MDNFITIAQPAFEQIKEKWYNEDFFMTKNEIEGEIKFGNEKEKHVIRFITSSCGFLNHSPYGISEEKKKGIMEALQQTLEEKMDFLLMGSQVIATGKKSEYIAQIMECLGDGLNKNLRLPIYSYLPDGNLTCVLLIHNRNNIIEEFESCIDAKKFIEKEQKEVEVMMELEREFEENIRQIEPNVQVYQNAMDNQKTFIINDLGVAFSVRKSIKDMEVLFEAVLHIDKERKVIVERDFNTFIQKVKDEFQLMKQKIIR